MRIVEIAGYRSTMYQVTSSSASGWNNFGFTEEDINHADTMQISVSPSSSTLRYWWDGSTPTSSEGHWLYPGDRLIVRGIRNIKQISIIAESGNNNDVAITIGRFGRTPS